MADFKTHVTASSLLGFGLGATAYLNLNFPLELCALGAGLCGISGMLPDMDSPTSVPSRETIALAAASVPMLMIDRFHQMNLTPEQIILFGTIIYFGIRFGLAEIFRRYTTHRGMWHSIPAALVASLIVLAICNCPQMDHRYFKAVCVFAGFISHLVLDELYSIDLSGRRIRVKSSLGTALKFWSGNTYANFSTYAKLAGLIVFLMFDSSIMTTFGAKPLLIPQATREWMERTLHLPTHNSNESESPIVDAHDHNHNVARQPATSKQQR
jgi:membrane-bound metal-dependent hydrolase YbcI (DUF457 family)